MERTATSTAFAVTQRKDPEQGQTNVLRLLKIKTVEDCKCPSLWAHSSFLWRVETQVATIWRVGIELCLPKNLPWEDLTQELYLLGRAWPIWSAVLNMALLIKLTLEGGCCGNTGLLWLKSQGDATHREKQIPQTFAFCLWHVAMIS